MKKWTIKGLKRCPSCQSSNIYKRVRLVQFVKDNRKRDKNFINLRVKAYRCHECKLEFDSPIIIW